MSTRDGEGTLGCRLARFSHLEIWGLETLLSRGGLNGGCITCEPWGTYILLCTQRTREGGLGFAGIEDRTPCGTGPPSCPTSARVPGRPHELLLMLNFHSDPHDCSQLLSRMALAPPPHLHLINHCRYPTGAAYVGRCMAPGDGE